MQSNKNEVACVLPVRDVDGGYLKKTYAELIKEISPDEVDKLYSYLEKFDENGVSNDEAATA